MNKYVRQTNKHNLTINLNQYLLKKISMWGKEYPRMKSFLLLLNAKAPAKHKHCIPGQEGLKLINQYTNNCVQWFSICCNSTCQHHQGPPCTQVPTQPQQHLKSLNPNTALIFAQLCNMTYHLWCAQLVAGLLPVGTILLHVYPSWGGQPKAWASREHLLNTQEAAGSASAQNVL